MAFLIGNFRLGRDPQKIEGPNGDFYRLSLAYDVYVDGETKTEWVSATYGGPRAPRVVPYLEKGMTIHASVQNVRATLFDSESGKRPSMEGRITEIEFISGRTSRKEQASETPAAEHAEEAD